MNKNKNNKRRKSIINIQMEKNQGEITLSTKKIIL